MSSAISGSLLEDIAYCVARGGGGLGAMADRPSQRDEVEKEDG